MSRRSRLLLWLVAGGVALLAVFGWEDALLVTGWGLPQRSAPPMLVVAHRGNMADWPEDTAESIWDAARMGAHGIEFDVHQSADGTWWVMHDASVDRTTDGTGRIGELTDAELAGLRIDAGPGYDPARHADIAPPMLETVLAGLADYPGRLFVDLQHSYQADVEALAHRLAGGDVTVICRSPEDVAVVEAVDPSLETLLRVDRIPPGAPVDMVFLEAVSEATVGGVAQQDRPVVTYRDDRYAHFADEWVLRRAWAAGVDAYLTKELRRALAQVEQLRSATAAP